MIDLRSDTLTTPTSAMRRAMAEAEVGDDQYSEDPTVNRLEALAAERLGKAAAVFVASGTMGNLCAVLAHCGRGNEVILGDQSHIFRFESGGAATLGGLPFHIIPNTSDGGFDLDVLEAAIRPTRAGVPRTGLVCVENTHNRCGGVALAPERVAAIAEIAHQHGVPVHCDGARIFNAAAALRVDARALAAPVDSVQFCLSKGLAAPVGSLIAGSEDFIREARRYRKMVGGAMRQAGVIAAAGVVALTEMVDRLPEDHANARRLAEGLAEIPGIDIDLATVQSNIVLLKIDDRAMTAAEFAERLRAEGIRVSNYDTRGLRMVTHYQISRADVEATIAAARRVMATVGELSVGSGR
jgi:threonine aldolase